MTSGRAKVAEKNAIECVSSCVKDGARRIKRNVLKGTSIAGQTQMEETSLWCRGSTVENAARDTFSKYACLEFRNVLQRRTVPTFRVINCQGFSGAGVFVKRTYMSQFSFTLPPRGNGFFGFDAVCLQMLHFLHTRWFPPAFISAHWRDILFFRSIFKST